MAFQTINQVAVSGIAAAVPRNVVENSSCGLFASQEEYARFATMVGIERRHICEEGVIASDLCAGAAEKLLEDLSWRREDIDLLIYVSQTMEYKLPATACCLQHRLGMSRDCMCFDVGMGCSGWVYGMGIAAGMIQTGHFRRCLLLAGDSHLANGQSKAETPLFGDCGTATALSFDPTSPPILIETGTDGSGYDAIICKSSVGGGSRYPCSENSFEWRTDEFGNKYRDVDIVMNGPAVFTFGITRVPACVRRMLQRAEKGVEDIDSFVFHQANLMMNEMIRKKCKIPVEKCPYSLRDFGNCSSASIPLTLVSQLAGGIRQHPVSLLACGFGVGLSWGTLHTTLRQPVISDLVYL